MYGMRFKLLLTFALLGLGMGQLAAQEYFPVNGARNTNNQYVAFTNATVFVDWQTKLEGATLLIKNGSVVAVGTEVEIPAGSVIENLNGKHIYPSFIDLDGSYGMPEVPKKKKQHGHSGGKPQYNSNKKGAYHWNQAIHPEVQAATAFTNNSKEAETLRAQGFGAVLTHQKDGIARGTAALVALGGNNANKAVLVPNAATEFSFQKGSSTQIYPTSQMGAIALLRQLWYDAVWYSGQQGAAETDLSIEALLANRELPAIFSVRDYLAGLRADKLGDEFGIQFIIRGSGDEYKRISEIKATEAAYILPLNFPLAFDVEDPFEAELVTTEQLRHWETAPHNARLLAEANIEFTFTLSGLKKPQAFGAAIQKVVAAGLPDSLALKALTYTPAALLGHETELGSLQPGMVANFIITSGAAFKPGTKLHENWVNGQQYIVNNYRTPDIRGNYDLNVAGEVGNLRIGGKPGSNKGLVVFNGDTAKATVKQNNNLISVAYRFDPSNPFTQLSGKINFNAGSWDGQAQLPNGSWKPWNAIRKPGTLSTSKEAKPVDAPAPVRYPNMAYGLDSVPSAGAVLFKNATVWTNGPQGILKNCDVLVRNGKIQAVGNNLDWDGNGTEVDATGKHLTSGIVDEHSHIAISRGVNEGSHAASAEVSIAHVVNPDDVNIYRHLAGGVTAAQLLHGSANPIGGQSALVKFRWGMPADSMLISDAAPFIKFALGENVKQSNSGDKNTVRFPQTRMGVEQVYYDCFYRASEYQAQWDAWNAMKPKAQKGKMPPRKDLQLEAIAEILRSERFITCHSYQQGEINMLMHVADSFGFRINTFTHILEGYKLADKMRKHGVAGSTFSDWWAYKFEVNDAIPHNAALLHNQGVLVAINSDDAEMGRRLNQEAAKTVKYGGLSEEDAWKTVTLNPAKMLHLDNRMGSVETGKDADLVLWSNNPLSVYAKVEQTYVDGRCYYSLQQDEALRAAMRADRARIIALMLEAKANGAPTQQPQAQEHKLYHCDTLEDDE